MIKLGGLALIIIAGFRAGSGVIVHGIMILLVLYRLASQQSSPSSGASERQSLHSVAFRRARHLRHSEVGACGRIVGAR